MLGKKLIGLLDGDVVPLTGWLVGELSTLGRWVIGCWHSCREETGATHAGTQDGCFYFVFVDLDFLYFSFDITTL